MNQGKVGSEVGWMDGHGSAEGAARVSGYEWADVCVMRQRVSQN